MLESAGGEPGKSTGVPKGLAGAEFAVGAVEKGAAVGPRVTPLGLRKTGRGLQSEVPQKTLDKRTVLLVLSE